MNSTPPDTLGSKAAAMLGALLDYIGIRLQLLRLEAEEAKGGLVRKAALIVAGGFFLLLSWIGICAGLVGFLALKLGWSWWAAAFLVAGSHLVFGVVFLLLAAKKPKNPLFGDSIREFAKDRDWLNSHRKKD
ncbi:MAG: phage holin family protein [Verrucomicrobiales bacterium]|nr:phage holin family protein [Verrucomicrobiales bacterium]